MITLPVLDSHAPPVRVMALHALAYCPRLFYLEEVEEIRVADDRVYAGRELHSSLAADEDGEAVQVELTSETVGLTGKVDCLRRRDGSHLPYEHKRGKPAKNASSWPRSKASTAISCVPRAATMPPATGSGRTSPSCRTPSPRPAAPRIATACADTRGRRPRITSRACAP